MFGGTVTDFEDFQKEEYGCIAEAHFKTNESISSFFRYYLLIMSLPISVLGIMVAIVARGDPGKNEQLTSLLTLIKPYAGVSLGIVALIGLAMMCYIITLRADAILYARSVNAVRKFFFDNANLDLATKLHLRVLPQTHSFPPYYADWGFLPVIVAFALFNSSYLAAAIFFLAQHYEIFVDYGTVVIVLPVFSVFALFHGSIFLRLGWCKENAAMKRNIIGIDIDGVLNQHREHFCGFLKTKTGKDLHPTSITKLPLHEHLAVLGVTRDDERAVFHDPEYWSGMPAIPEVATHLRRIRNSFHLKAILFTHRPWPDIKRGDNGYKDMRAQWLKAAHSSLCKLFVEQVESWGWRLELLWMMVTLHVGWKSPLEVITKVWLAANGLTHDGLTVEKGGDKIPYPRGKFKNRFNLSKKCGFRFFVEDDWEKAVRLAHTCDVVFLLDQPYNTSSVMRRDSGEDSKPSVLPGNVLRVYSWQEIVQFLRRSP